MSPSRIIRIRPVIASSMPRGGGGGVPLAGLGTAIPTRLPASTGTVRTAGTKSAFDAALAASNPGDIVSLTSNIIGSAGTSWTWSKSGTSTNPITILGNGYTISTFAGLFQSGNYVIHKDLQWTNCGVFSTSDGMKLDGQFCEFDGCIIYGNIGSGMLWGSVCQHPAIWNCIFFNNGQNLNYDHGLYGGHCGTGGFGGSATINAVVVNSLFYDNYGYNCQFYPDCDGLLFAGCTVYGGMAHDANPPHSPSDGPSNNRGGIILGGNTGQAPDNVRMVGIISANAISSPGFHIGSSSDPSAPTNSNIYDSISYNNAGGASDGGAGVTYTPALSTANPLFTNPGAKDFTLQPGSPAISKVQAARYQYLPPYDILGNPRVTADAGCYAS